MALWKDNASTKNRDATALATEPALATAPATPTSTAPSAMAVDTLPRSTSNWDTSRRGEVKESVIGSQLSIEGKIEGSGHVRIAGRFTGDVTVDGNLTIEPGAVVNGGVKAHTVVIGGELNGNVIEAGTVELLAGGVLIGDLRAGTFTVAAGSRMRGRVEFGWQDGRTHREGNGASDL